MLLAGPIETERSAEFFVAPIEARGSGNTEPKFIGKALKMEGDEDIGVIS